VMPSRWLRRRAEAPALLRLEWVRQTPLLRPVVPPVYSSAARSCGERSTIGDGSFPDQVRHLILPAFVLSIRHIAGWSRYMRSSLLDVIRADFIRTARAKGLREQMVLVRHAVKNALIPVVSIMALDLAGLFSGAVIAETIFAWPGIGRLFVQAMFSRDYPLLMGILMMSSFLVVFFNLIADVVYGWLDPRISYT